MDSTLPNEIFKCSTPYSNVKYNSDLVCGVSPSNSFGGTRQKEHEKRGRKQGNRMGGEDEILIQKINLRFVNVEKDGKDVIKGLNKVKNKVQGLLEVAKTTVEEFGKVDDNKGRYQCASQKLANMGDEMTLLSVCLSQFLHNTLEFGNIHVDSPREESLVMSAKNTPCRIEPGTSTRKEQEGNICGQNLTKGESWKDGEVLDITNKSGERVRGNCGCIGENVIPLVDRTLNPKENTTGAKLTPINEKHEMYNYDTTQMNSKQTTEDSKPKSATQNVVFLSNDFNEEGNKINGNLKETETNKFGSISSCPEDHLTTVPPKEKLIENPTIFRVSDTTLQNICELEKFDTGYKGTFTFVEGCPSTFWIRQDTPGLANLQTYLKTRFKDKGIAGRKPILGVGSKVLAKFFTDGKLYRARMEEVMMEGDNDEDCLYSVRYTDYGSSDVVSGRDIQSWESHLDYIPDQAVSCRLVDGPEHWKGRNWTVDQLGVFHQIIGQNSGSLSVELRANLRAGQTNYNIWDPMFEAYVCRGGVSIVDFLRKHPIFRKAFLDGEPPGNDDTSPQKTNKSDNILPGKSKIAKINPIESTNSGPNSAFPLKSVAASPEEQGSPIPSVIITEAKSKVTEWLENKCQNENPPTSSPNDSSIISFRAKLRPQSKNKLPQSLELESCKVTPVCAVDTLKIEEEADGSFLYFLSMVESPGKFYLHPVQKETTFIDNISAEIASHSLYAPKEHCVVAETVWALCNLIDNKWYRVRVEGRTSKTVSVRYIDYGTSHERIRVDSLRYLPDSWVTKLPGLAVRCHLAGCSPNRKTWDPKSAAQLEKMVGYEKQNRGMAAKLEFGSLGVILITEEDLIINEKIVDCQK